MNNTQVSTSSGPARCFVVMGFGVKTDYATGRKLDLDKSYRLLIKPVVEAKGFVCVRADEIRHSGAIDVPMYQELLTADIVIADLSTANPNALYELGIRHALRPQTTIVISENKLPYPFDLNHVAITGYTHLGDAIDYEEVIRFRNELGATLDSVLRDQKTDSPVYTFLQQLTPPALGGQAAQAVAQAGQALERAGEAIAQAVADSRAPEPGPEDKTLATIIEQGEQAIKGDRFSEAKTLFALALQLGKSKQESGSIAHDPYLIQRLVLATYKAKQPDEVSALNEALRVLAQLDPKDSNDPETVGLAGAIEKRHFDKDQGVEHLNRAISYYGRGYYLRNDWYNGINLAYLLNVRTDTVLDATQEDRIADLVWANRIRREVLALCEQDLHAIHERAQRMAINADESGSNAVKEDQKARDKDQEFWCLATKAEAHFGLGEMAAYQQARSAAQALEHANWMMDTFNEQIGRLRSLLETHGHLLTPTWPAF
jgi:tetratricopeptide repeat protein